MVAWSIMNLPTLVEFWRIAGDHAVHLGLVAQEELLKRCLVAAGHLLQQGPLERSVADALILFSRDLHWSDHWATPSDRSAPSESEPPSLQAASVATDATIREDSGDGRVMFSPMEQHAMHRR